MISRELSLGHRLDQGFSVLLLGPRGVGKTMLARQVLSHRADRLEIDLLAPESYERYLRDPSLFEQDVLGRQAKVVFVDEIQKLPGLLDVIHRLYERERVQFLLTGSSARKLRRGGANLLAGRLLGMRLHPLTCREVALPESQILQFGSLPGVVLENPAPDATLRAYVHLYLKEEILEEALVRKTVAFSRFLELAGQYHGEPVNATRIGRLVGVSAHTVQEYFQILEDTLMVFRLPGWSASVTRQLRTAPRYFLFDNGVAHALKGELRVESSPRTSRFGKLFESRVLQEAFWLNDYRELDLKFSYWQSNTGLEIDLIASRGAGPPLAALEIKSDTAPGPSHWKGLTAFRSEYPEAACFCLCRTPHPYRASDGVEVLPWTEGLEILASL
ncbi:MAG: hypothetical protein AMXMBFR33_31180 [Candidatus Xenobia bacterium]|jgi:predicted AAA+ superfamily ATPase